MKKLLGTLLFTVTGCSTGGGNYSSNYHDPELFRCPSSHFAMCEGNSPTTMDKNMEAKAGEKTTNDHLN